jgi:hypothetical protein
MYNSSKNRLNMRVQLETPTNRRQRRFWHWLLLVSSLGAAALSLVFFMLIAGHPLAWSLVAAAAVAVLWPIAGAIVTWISAGMRRVAYGAGTEPHDLETRLIQASLWPLTAVHAIIVYPSMFLILRLFPGS